MSVAKKQATREDWLLKCQLLEDPNCMMEDEYGHPAEPWQQAMSRHLVKLLDSLVWKPTIVKDGNGKYGVWNQFEECWLVPCEFEDIGELPEQHPFEVAFFDPIPVKKEGKWGLISSEGKKRELLPFEYDSITVTNAGFLLEKNHLFGLYRNCHESQDTQSFLDCVADAIWLDEKLDIVLYARYEKIGLVEPHTEANFDSVGTEREENQPRVLVSKNGEVGYLSLFGEFIPKEDLPYWKDDLILRCEII